MNMPIDTTDNGCAFALRVGYDAKCYAGNVGTGGWHFPATSVCVVYQLCGRMREHAYPTLPQRGVGKLSRHGVEQDAGNGRHRDMGGVK